MNPKLTLGFTRVMTDVFAYQQTYAASDAQILQAWKDGRATDSYLDAHDLASLRSVSRAFRSAFERPKAKKVQTTVEELAQLQSRRNRPKLSELRQGMLQVPCAWHEEHGDAHKQIRVLQALQHPHPIAGQIHLKSERESALVWLNMSTLRVDANRALIELNFRRKLCLTDTFFADSKREITISIAFSGFLACLGMSVFTWSRRDDLRSGDATGNLSLGLCSATIGIVLLHWTGFGKNLDKLNKLRRIANQSRGGLQERSHEDDAYLLHQLADHVTSWHRNCLDDEVFNEKCNPWMNHIYFSSNEET